MTKSSQYGNFISYLLAYFFLLTNEINKAKAFQVNNCRELDPSVYYWCPTKRYCAWMNHTEDIRSFLSFQIGYEGDKDWNYFKINPLETTYFADLRQTVQNGLEDLGYVEDTHDCCLGHYESYDWVDFDVADGYGEVKAALELMGYDESTWMNDTVLEWDDYWWDELPLEIQHAAYDGLCYTRELWDLIPMTLWSEETFYIPGSYYFDELDDDTLFDGDYFEIEFIDDDCEIKGEGLDISTNNDSFVEQEVKAEDNSASGSDKESIKNTANEEVMNNSLVESNSSISFVSNPNPDLPAVEPNITIAPVNEENVTFVNTVEENNTSSSAINNTTFETNSSSSFVSNPKPELPPFEPNIPPSHVSEGNNHDVGSMEGESTYPFSGNGTLVTINNETNMDPNSRRLYLRR